MRFLALPFFAVAVGCYTYTPVQPASVTPGAGVRARVSASAAERLAPLVGVNDARLLTGTFVGTDAAGFLVEVPTTSQVGTAGTLQSLAQRISIPRGDLLELETRTLDRTRTAIVVGGVAIIAGSTAAPAQTRRFPCCAGGFSWHFFSSLGSARSPC